LVWWEGWLFWFVCGSRGPQLGLGVVFWLVLGFVRSARSGRCSAWAVVCGVCSLGWVGCWLGLGARVCVFGRVCVSCVRGAAAAAVRRVAAPCPRLSARLARSEVRRSLVVGAWWRRSPCRLALGGGGGVRRVAARCCVRARFPPRPLWASWGLWGPLRFAFPRPWPLSPVYRRFALLFAL